MNIPKMNRDQQQVDTIQLLIGRLIDPDSPSAIINEGALLLIVRAQDFLDKAYLALTIKDGGSNG